MPANLTKNPVHLGLGGTAIPLPEFTGDMEWYGDYAQRFADDGKDGRLVTIHSFSESWSMWEVHPVGAEVVLCLEGEMTLIQKDGPDGEESSVHVKAGEYVINEPGVWHTADLDGPATALFITAGEGTENHPR